MLFLSGLLKTKIVLYVDTLLFTSIIVHPETVLNKNKALLLERPNNFLL